jgi:hypothetical protein
MQSFELGFSSGSALQEGPTGLNYIWCSGPRQETSLGAVAHSGEPELMLWPTAGKQILCCGPQRVNQIWCCGPQRVNQICCCGSQRGIELGAVDQTGEPDLVLWTTAGSQTWCWQPKRGNRFGAVEHNEPNSALWSTVQNRWQGVARCGGLSGPVKRCSGFSKSGKRFSRLSGPKVV